MRLAAAIALAILAVALAAGCGSSSGDGSTSQPPDSDATAPAGAIAIGCDAESAGVEALRATAVGCGEARQVLGAWQQAPACAGSPGDAHAACTVGSYRCIATRADRGLAVSCARPGHSIAFIVRD